jgi:glycosyltransferase involved in cell wall biosynthesis
VPARPLVSVITATWQRHSLLLRRCIPSVHGQTYPAVEHIVVSDGPDPELRGVLRGRVRYAELDDHDPTIRWGHRARLRGIELAKGPYIAWLDDDDAYHSDHLERCVRALVDHGVDFVYSKMAIHRPDVPAGLRPWLATECGVDPPGFGQIATSAIVHRRELLETATWRQFRTTDPDPPLDEPLPLDDWDLVRRWLEAGATYLFTDAATVDYFPGGGSIRP